MSDPSPRRDGAGSEAARDHISVCVCTFRRPATLERLLCGLARQATGGAFSVSVVVVDNDPDGSARELVARVGAGTALGLVYEVEPERSIPAARNHALRLAEGNFIAIIDDDEFPGDDWLMTMHSAVRAGGVDGALGPVLPHFEGTPPRWLIRGRFCERPVIPTGTVLTWDQTRTGNVLIRKSVFEKGRLTFDLKWRTSGSDRAFFKQAMQAGFRFIAVAEAPVFETVPPERWKAGYYVKRALVHGYNSYRNNKNDLGWPRRLLFALKSTVAVGGYAILLPFSLPVGKHAAVKLLEKGAHHLSGLAAMAGIELVKKRDF